MRTTDERVTKELTKETARTLVRTLSSVFSTSADRIRRTVRIWTAFALFASSSATRLFMPWSRMMVDSVHFGQSLDTPLCLLMCAFSARMAARNSSRNTVFLTSTSGGSCELMTISET